MKLSIVRTPEIIATEINIIKDQTRRMMLYNSIEIGRKLTESKELISHGEWGEWGFGNERHVWRVFRQHIESAPHWPNRKEWEARCGEKVLLWTGYDEADAYAYHFWMAMMSHAPVEGVAGDR